MPNQDLERIGGCADATLNDRTGKGWSEWVEYLDAAGAAELDHPAIVELVDPAIDRWWAQTITVGYERIKGRRALGQTASGSFAASKSITLPVGLDRARQAFLPEEREAWLPITLQDRQTTSPSSLRFDLPDSARAAVWFTEKGPSKCSLSVQIERLPSAQARDAAREAWGRYLKALKAHVTG